MGHGKRMKDVNTLRTILLAMQETARVVATEPPSDHRTSAGRVSPSFLRHVNQVLREVNAIVPTAGLGLFDENTIPTLVTYPKTSEVLQQIKLALTLLGTPPSSAQAADVTDTAHPQAVGKTAPPEVFIGCSVEGLRVAKVLQVALADSARPVIWHQGVFGLSRGTLESLVVQVHRFKYAILILTPDDLLVKHGEATPVARDNVLFELGLFTGALGRERTFIVCESSVSLPSDLAGITPVKYELTEPTNIVADLGPVCTKMEIEMGLL